MFVGLNLSSDGRFCYSNAGIASEMTYAASKPLATGDFTIPQGEYPHAMLILNNQIYLKHTQEYDEDITRTVYSGSSFSSYFSLPVFNLEPNRVNTPESIIEVFPEVTNFLSKSMSYTHTTEGQIRSKFTWSFDTRAEAYELVKFFDEQCGKWGNFWYPSWMDDIELTSPFDSSDTVLDIQDIQWSTYWENTESRSLGTLLYILLPDGTEIIRYIVDAPTSTQIEVDSAMGTTITSTAGVICCFLYMGRFNVDELTLRYDSEHYSSAQLQLATLQDFLGFSEI